MARFLPWHLRQVGFYFVCTLLIWCFLKRFFFCVFFLSSKKKKKQPKLISKIKRYRPDLLCIQVNYKHNFNFFDYDLKILHFFLKKKELDGNDAEEFMSHLNHYQFKYKQRTNEKKDGCCIAWNKRLLFFFKKN